MNKGKSVSKVVLWQMLARFLLQGISIISTPIFTRLLSTEDFGYLSNYNAWLAIIGVIVGLQTNGAIANAKIKYEENEYRRFLSSIYFLSVLTYLVAIVLCIPLQGILGNIMGVTSKLVPIMFIQSFFSFTVAFYSSVLMQDKRVEINTMISLFSAVGTLALSVAFVHMLNSDKYIGRIEGAIVPAAVISSIEIVVIFRRGKTAYNKDFWQYCLKLSAPLIFHGLSAMILTMSDRIMLNRMSGPSFAGIYTVAYSMGAVLDIIWNALNTSWVPFYYEYKKKDDQKVLRHHLNKYMRLYTILTVGFLLCAPEVFKVFASENFWSGTYIIPIIAVAYYMNFLYSFPANFEFFHENTVMISVGTVLSALLNIALNFLLIPEYNGIGAAIATAISYGALFVFHLLIATKYIKNKYEANIIFFVKGLVPSVIVAGLYYFTLNLMVVRWIAAIVMGIFLLRDIIRTREII